MNGLSSLSAVYMLSVKRINQIRCKGTTKNAHLQENRAKVYFRVRFCWKWAALYDRTFEVVLYPTDTRLVPSKYNNIAFWVQFTSYPPTGIVFFLTTFPKKMLYISKKALPSHRKLHNANCIIL